MEGDKMTEIGALPEEWEVMRFGNAAELIINQKYNEPRISRNFGLRSVRVCEAYPSFDKPFLKVYADERRYVHAAGFGEIIHRKGRKERKATEQESLCPLYSPWLNASSAPAHGRAPQPAVHSRLSRAGDERGGREDGGEREDA